MRKLSLEGKADGELGLVDAEGEECESEGVREGERVHGGLEARGELGMGREMRDVISRRRSRLETKRTVQDQNRDETNQPKTDASLTFPETSVFLDGSSPR